MLTVRVHSDGVDLLNDMAKEFGTTRSDLLRAMLSEALNDDSLIRRVRRRFQPTAKDLIR